jgi:N-acetylglutamate synthase-like GNAT family acetyltransferase
MIIRRFEYEDAGYVADLINQNFFKENIKIYTKDELNAIIFSEEKVRAVAGYAHMYVCCIDNVIVGCGTISSRLGSPEDSILLTIFVKPELHKKGIGNSIMETLEKEELYLQARKIEIPSPKTACEVYLKMGL